MTILILRVSTQFFHEFQFESSSSFFVCSLYTLFMRRILFCISIENFIEILPLIYHGSSIYKPNFYYQQFHFVRSVISILFMMTNMPDWGFTSFTVHILLILYLLAVVHNNSYSCLRCDGICLFWVWKLAYCFALF